MEKKTFAFKLANKSADGISKWKARDGISLAGCTWSPCGCYRYSQWRLDDGYYC